MKTPSQKYNKQWEINEPRVRALMADLPEFNANSIRRKSAIGMNQADKILRHWLDNGIARFHRRGERNEKFFVFTSDVPEVDVEPIPARPSTEGNLWRSMRLLSSFTARDLAAHATAGGVEVDEAQAKAYCAALLKSDYLSVLEMADPSIGRLARFRLLENTGPDAPILRRVRILYDPNVERTHLLGGTPS